VTITQATQEINDPGSLGGPICAGSFARKTGSGGFSSLGSGGTTPGLGWQTLTYSLSESTTGRSYQFTGQFTNTVTDDTAKLGSMTITYTSSDLSKTL
jgi:hypothetical protein